MIEAMHRDGARVFVEVGPGSILTPLIDAILKDRAHLAVACDAPGSSGLAGWLRAIARLVAAGVAARPRTTHRGPGRSACSIWSICRPAKTRKPRRPPPGLSMAAGHGP